MRSLQEYIEARVSSTCRTAEFYRHVLFPEHETVADLIQYFKSTMGYKLDAGCGRNGGLPYSLINQYYRCKEPTAMGIPNLYGIEPREKPAPGKLACFSANDDLLLFQRYIGYSLKRLCELKRLHISCPGKKYCIRGIVQQTGLDTGSVRHILSSFNFPGHTTDDEELLSILQECHRLLMPEDGDVRMYPVNQEIVDELQDSSTAVGSFALHHFNFDSWLPYPRMEKILPSKFGFTLKLSPKANTSMQTGSDTQ